MPELKPFVCPSCGASLNLTGNETQVTCTSCGYSVIVPEEYRTHPTPPVQSMTPPQVIVMGGSMPNVIDAFGVQQEFQQEIQQSMKLARRGIGCTLLVTLIIIGGVSLGIWYFVQGFIGGITGDISTVTGAIGGSSQGGTAIPMMSFGGKGTAPGMFTQPRLLTVDPQGPIYVTDEGAGLVQRFDRTGRYENGWKVGGKNKPLMSCLATDRFGHVYVCLLNTILEYSGEGGTLVKTFTGQNSGDDFVSASVQEDGRLIALSDEFQDDLVFFNANGTIANRITKIVSTQSEDSVNTPQMAVDGQGNIYISDQASDYIFRFTPDGKYVNRFGGKSDDSGKPQPGTFSEDIDTIAVDNQSRVYVGYFGSYDVFDANGHYLHPLVLPVPASAFGFALDSSNNVYFLGADDTGHKITVPPSQ